MSAGPFWSSNLESESVWEMRREAQAAVRQIFTLEEILNEKYSRIMKKISVPA